MNTTCGRDNPRLNLLLFTAADRLGGGRIRLAGQRLRHLLQVLGNRR